MKSLLGFLGNIYLYRFGFPCGDIVKSPHLTFDKWYLKPICWISGHEFQKQSDEILEKIGRYHQMKKTIYKCQICDKEGHITSKTLISPSFLETSPKKLEYYMSLPYEIHINRDYNEDEKKDIYYAYISELGKHACYGQGYTIKEALSSLELEKEDIISYLLEKGTPIPEPIPSDFFRGEELMKERNG